MTLAAIVRWPTRTVRRLTCVLGFASVTGGVFLWAAVHVHQIWFVGAGCGAAIAIWASYGLRALHRRVVLCRSRLWMAVGDRSSRPQAPPNRMVRG